LDADLAVVAPVGARPAGGVGLFEVSVEQLDDRQIAWRAMKITGTQWKITQS
jgi:hypothetical protein